MSVGLPPCQRLDRRDIGTGKHGLGHPAAEASSRKRAEFARIVGGRSAEWPEPASPGKGAGRRQIGIQCNGPQARNGIGGIGCRHSLCRQPGSHRAHRLAAAMQHLHPRRGVSRVVEQPSFPIARYERVDQRRRRLLGFGRAPVDPPLKHSPEILRRTGIAAEVVERPTFK